jgi:hypothetical protein
VATQETETRPTGADDLKLVVQAAQNAIAQEFQIAERLDAKSRNQVAIASTWFALVQAVVGLAFRSSDGPSSWLSAIIIVCGAIGALALAATLVLSFIVWRPRDEDEVTPEGLRQMAEAARTRPDEFSDLMFRHYGAILRARRTNNKSRAEWFDRSVLPWVATLAGTLVELGAALYAIAQP